MCLYERRDMVRAKLGNMHTRILMSNHNVVVI